MLYLVTDPCYSFRSSIKNESDIKTLFLLLTGNFKNPL